MTDAHPESEFINYEFKLTADEYREIQSALMPIKWPVLLFAVALISVLAGVLAEDWIPGVIVAAALIFIVVCSIAKNRAQQWKTNPIWQGTWKVRLGPDGTYTETAEGYGLSYWKSLTKYVESENFIALLSLGNTWCIFPKVGGHPEVPVALLLQSFEDRGISRRGAAKPS